MYSFIVYLYVNDSDSITSVGEERELICLLLFTCNYVVSVWRGFLFLWVLGMGYFILLWHSLSLPLIIFQRYMNRIVVEDMLQLANMNLRHHIG